MAEEEKIPDDLPPDDGMGRVLPAAALNQAFTLIGLDYGDFAEAHPEAEAQLLDFAVMGEAHFPDEPPAAMGVIDAARELVDNDADDIEPLRAALAVYDAEESGDEPTDEELAEMPDAEEVKGEK